MSERKTPKELEGLKQEIEKDERHFKELLKEMDVLLEYKKCMGGHYKRQSL